MFAYVITCSSPVSKKDQNYEATRLHFENLVKRYGHPVIILNLIKVASIFHLLKEIILFFPIYQMYLISSIRNFRVFLPTYYRRVVICLSFFILVRFLSD